MKFAMITFAAAAGSANALTGYNMTPNKNLKGPSEGCDTEMDNSGCSDVADCEAKCDANQQCIGFVTHPWGANMKTSVPSEDCLINRPGFEWYQKSDYTVGDPKRSVEPTFACINSECIKWTCDEWCECWDESYDYDQHGCADDDDTPCDCGHWSPVVAPVAVPTYNWSPSSSSGYRPCSSMPNVITNTQCKDMTLNPDSVTAETCEASCCESSCQTWLFEEDEGCYHSENACTVMWQGTGGATGWNGGSALRLIEACACRECGKPTDTTTSLGWTNGICGIATDSCSGTSPIKGGCYSSTSSHCDCSTLKTV